MNNESGHMMTEKRNRILVVISLIRPNRKHEEFYCGNKKNEDPLKMNHCVKREKNSWLRDTFLRKESTDGNTDNASVVQLRWTSLIFISL